jgi:exodeoxyribonuclease VII small subunit
MKDSFENKMEELQKIVEELEKGELSLDDSVSKFEQGMKISQECNKMLEKAEKKITILLNKDNEYQEEEFESENN